MDQQCLAHDAHRHTMEQAACELPAEEELAELSQIFKIFGDPTRLKILSVLAAGELCVCDIAGLAGASQSTVSHQLRLLRAYRLVRVRREGKGAFYALDDTHVLSIIQAGLDHVKEEDENNEQA